MWPFRLPPFASTNFACSNFFTFAEPWNIMCSKRCAKAGAAFRLETEADVVIDGDRDHRRDVIFGDHDLQAVRKFVIDDWNVEWFCLGEKRRWLSASAA